MKHTLQIIAVSLHDIETAANRILVSAADITLTGMTAADTYSTTSIDALAQSILDIIADVKEES